MDSESSNYVSVLQLCYYENIRFVVDVMVQICLISGIVFVQETTCDLLIIFGEVFQLVHQPYLTLLLPRNFRFGKESRGVDRVSNFGDEIFTSLAEMTLLRQKITGGRGKSIASVIEQIEKSFVFLLLL